MTVAATSVDFTIRVVGSVVIAAATVTVAAAVANFCVTDSCCCSWLVAQLQLALLSVEVARDSLGGHDSYAYVNTFCLYMLCCVTF